MQPSRALTLALLLTGTGCSTSSSAAAGDTPLCDDGDAGPTPCLGCAVPSAVWADAGPLSCPRSIETYCDQNVTPVPATTAPSCPPGDWSAVLASARQYGSPFPLYACDGFELATPSWWCGEATVLFVYDGASGHLASVVELGGGAHAGQQTCLAGGGDAPSLDAVSAHCRVFVCGDGEDASACGADAGPG
jgi:hypothetical protein